MNPYERVMAVLSGEKPDRVPVFPWVRDWCLKQVGFEIVDMMENVEKYVYAQYQSRRDFGYDVVFDLCAIEAVSEAMGVKLYYDNQTPPRPSQHLIDDYGQDLARLKMPDPHRDGRLPLILEGIRRLKEICQGEIPVVGYTQGPLRHASTMRNYETLMRDMFKNPEPLQKLMEIATESLIVCAEALVQAGADIVLVSDPPSSGDMISRKQFEEWGRPGLERLVKFLKGTGVKVILHVCGETLDRLDLFAQLGIDAMSVDEKVDLAAARKLLGEGICLLGNVSPSNTLFLGRPEDVERESRECLEKAGRNGPFILGSGCLTSAEAKAENIAAMVAAAHKYGQY